PSRLREDLLVLLLIDRDHGAAVVEDHEPRARGALVQGTYVVRHVGPPSGPFVGAMHHSTFRRRSSTTGTTTWRRGLDARRCAHPGSSRVPCGPRVGSCLPCPPRRPRPTAGGHPRRKRPRRSP